MALKKNDQIIIILAIFVIIVAGIGIALYSQPVETNTVTQNILEDMKTYEVTWHLQNASISSVDEFANKKAAYEGTLTIPRGNLKSITFNMSWVDNKAFLGIFGLDTLTLEVTAPDGTTISDSMKSMRRTKEGNIVLTFNNINDREPSTIPFDAQTLQDAQQQLKQSPYYNDKWVDDEFTVKVSVSVGEILGRIRPRDQGNAFTIDVEYQYYSGSIDEIKETIHQADEDVFTDMSQQHSTIGIMVTTGSGVRW
ncbi:MAG: hypothetical protein V1726_06980 [Methanobacteriota archaeon]